jgi:hypothetical protein
MFKSGRILNFVNVSLQESFFLVPSTTLVVMFWLLNPLSCLLNFPQKLFCMT